MKNIVKIWAPCLLIALGLVACGGGEEAPETTVESTPAEQPDTAEPAASGDEAPPESDDTQVVVEESAAEPEEDEQPIILAQADTDAAALNLQFKEGQHYTRMVPSQPTMGGADKIEVAEFFSYSCPHCYAFEPTINAWAAEVPANVRFVRIPAVWNRVYELHGRVFFTQDILARNGALADGEAFHAAVFQEIHQRGNRLTSEDTIRRLFERFGVSAEQFDRTWNSFEVDQKMRVAQDLARRYQVRAVPAIVVNGKYRTGGVEAGGNDVVPAVVDELILRESQR
jgi:thiol:disulfide interchange protein DsbA